MVDEEELLENVFFVERSLLLYVLGNPVCCSWTVVDVRLTCCEGGVDVFSLANLDVSGTFWYVLMVTC